MAKASAREFVVKSGGTAIAAVRTKTVRWGGTLIDVTTDDDDGDAAYLADKFAGTSLELSVEGIVDDDVLADIAFVATHADKHVSNITVERANGDAISGNFILTSYEESGEYQGSPTFSATLVRNGTHTWTPSA